MRASPPAVRPCACNLPAAGHDAAQPARDPDRRPALRRVRRGRASVHADATRGPPRPRRRDVPQGVPPHAALLAQPRVHRHRPVREPPRHYRQRGARRGQPPAAQLPPRATAPGLRDGARGQVAHGQRRLAARRLRPLGELRRARPALRPGAQPGRSPPRHSGLRHRSAERGDDGYLFGEHALGPERRVAYEEGIRSPFLVRYPPLVAAGSRPEALVLTIDIAPTMVALAGGTPGPQMQGRSLLPLLGGQRPPDWRTSFLVEYWSENAMPWLVGMTYKAVRTERAKLIHWANRDGVDELSDLAADPYELHNLIDDPARARERQELRRELARLVAEAVGL